MGHGQSVEMVTTNLRVVYVFNVNGYGGSPYIGTLGKEH
jgi:hypothetical protein